MSEITIRNAEPGDAALILKFITELAIYEKAEDEVIATEEDIRESIFGENSTVKGLICLVDNRPAGFAVYFYNYSTWLGKKGIYLEDLYVSPDFRRFGAGRALFKELAQIALAQGCERLEWNVLDWNEPAIAFYESIGGEAKSEWIGYRLSGEALKAMGQG